MSSDSRVSNFFPGFDPAKINCPDEEGLTVLHRALQSDDIPAPVVEELIRLGADVNLMTLPVKEDGIDFDMLDDLDIEIPDELRELASKKTAPSYTPLHFACRSSDTNKVRILLQHGAEAKMLSSSNYSAILDATFQALDLPIEKARERFELLVNHGADLEQESDHGESPLKTAARHFRVDLVSCLIELGADRSSLQWNDLFEAIAFGDSDLIREVARQQPHLMETLDFSGTSPLRFAVQLGEKSKAEALVECGMDLDGLGRFDENLLFPAVDANSPEMCEWLIKSGLSIHHIDKFEHHVLEHAVQCGADKCIPLLIQAGADLHFKNQYGFGLAHDAPDVPTAMALHRAGLDLTELEREVKHEILGLPYEAEISCSAEEYRSHRTRIFGRQNPETMSFPFWREMVRNGKSGYFGASHFDDSSFDSGVPTWCVDRFGQTFTLLPDGRIVEIAGEHEDSYDPDFCIYNDVIVHDRKGDFTIYGYPEEVFLPTDYHSATLFDQSIVIIGGVGYSHQREEGTTNVYRLDLNSFAIQKMKTSGENPGWIARHRATRMDPQILRIEGGEVYAPSRTNEDSPFPKNDSVFELDLQTGVWVRV